MQAWACVCRHALPLAPGSIHKPRRGSPRRGLLLASLGGWEGLLHQGSCWAGALVQPPHLWSPTQLIEDKKVLSEKCEAVVAELKQEDQRCTERVAQVQAQHELVRLHSPLHSVPGRAHRPGSAGTAPRTGSDSESSFLPQSVRATAVGGAVWGSTMAPS